MSHSIRQRFVDWLQGVINHRAKKPMNVLSGPNIHPYPAGDLNQLFVVGVPNYASKSQVDNAEMLASFQRDINEMNRAAVIPDFKGLLAKSNAPASPNHDFINHQPSPIGTIFDLSKVNARAQGVEWQEFLKFSPVPASLVRSLDERVSPSLSWPRSIFTLIRGFYRAWRNGDDA